jgi:hypothetical protein
VQKATGRASKRKELRAVRGAGATGIMVGGKEYIGGG